MSFTPSNVMWLRPVNRWLAQRYNVNNAWIFNGTNGNLNNNNVTNRYRVQAVTNLHSRLYFTLRLQMNEKELRRKNFSRQIETYFAARKNKRYGRDQIAYEVGWVGRTVRSFRERERREFRIRHNYAFLTSVPRWREIFATEMEGRCADHELCDALMPYVERELTDRTYNNRKGKGGQAAINQVVEDMCEASGGYVSEAWVLKVDIAAFFPSALWTVSERYITDVIDRHAAELTADGYDPGYLRWMTMILLHANPAAHCELRTPRWLWKGHISDEKSLFSKPEGVGAAIGRLTWQTAMGLYVNDDIRWLSVEKGIRAVCFVDDIVLCVPASQKEYALATIGELRGRLAKKGLRLHPRKFYCQRVCHGLEFLGSHIKPYRLHLNRSTVARAMRRIGELNTLSDKRQHTNKLLSSMNSYAGLMKGRNDRRRLQLLRRSLDSEWWQYVSWDAGRQCLVYKHGCSPKERLNRKYGLKLKNLKRYTHEKCTF